MNTNAPARPDHKAAELDALWQQFQHSAPVLTMPEVERASDVLLGTEGARAVRAGLAILTKSGAELLELVHRDADAPKVLAELSAVLDERVGILRAAADTLNTAHTRIALALCDVPGGAA
jgi:hypothetical protein